MRTANPALNDKTFTSVRSFAGATSMTLSGTVNKTAVLLTLALCGAIFTWTTFTQKGVGAMPWAIGGAVVAFVVALVLCFKQSWAPLLAPLYGVCEGLFLGAVSASYEARFQGLVFKAVFLTLATLFCLLFAYRAGFIRASEKFKMGVFAATGAIALVYLVGFVMSFFGKSIPYIHESGWIGIGFSVFVVVLAAANLVLDFEFIENGAASGAPKYMEWYAAFGLMVTLVWLYLEILRLLAKLSSRRD